MNAYTAYLRDADADRVIELTGIEADKPHTAIRRATQAATRHYAFRAPQVGERCSIVLLRTR